MRLLILGDTHNYWERAVPTLEEAYKIYNFEAIIQVGDLCYLPQMWTNGIFAPNQLIIDFINNNGLKFYWIDGNHEDHSVLQYVDDFNNSVHNIYGPNFFYQPRGSYKEIGEHILLFIGGADSIDKHNRTEGKDYFREELILRHQEDFVLQQIDKIKLLNKKTIVIAHTCPQSAIVDERNILDLMNASGIGHNKFLDEVVKELNPTLYFHGHFHKERVYSLPKHKNTTFFSTGAFVSERYQVNDRKFFILEI